MFFCGMIANFIWLLFVSGEMIHDCLETLEQAYFGSQDEIKFLTDALNREKNKVMFTVWLNLIPLCFFVVSLVIENNEKYSNVFRFSCI